MKVIAIVLFVFGAGIASAQKPAPKPSEPAKVSLASDAPAQAAVPVTPSKQKSALPSEASVAPTPQVASAKSGQTVLPSSAGTQGVDKAPAPAKQ